MVKFQLVAMQWNVIADCLKNIIFNSKICANRDIEIHIFTKVIDKSDLVPSWQCQCKMRQLGNIYSQGATTWGSFL